MLLKSIKLYNFRQFSGTNEIEFSTQDNKNVSVVLGENGSGKTSLAQAFTWCLYGITDFQDPSMLNKAVETKLLPGNEAEVKVEIKLVHGGTEYSVHRVQLFRKKNNGDTISSPPTLHISKKNNGQQEFLNNPEFEIKQILPKELAGYFFLNGEHIEKLNKELKKGKSNEFAEAVENLLGLKAFLEAMDHFSPSKRNSVIGYYNSQYDGNSNQAITDLQNEIQRITEEISRLSNLLQTLDTEIEKGKDICAHLEEIIRDNIKSREYQLKIDKFNKDILVKKRFIEDETTLLLSNFNKYGLAFLSKSLITDALNILSSEQVVDKGIPDIHERTIRFLMERGFCICGTAIIDGEEPHTHLVQTLNYIPPKSIGKIVSDFLLECGNNVRNSEVYFPNFKNSYAHIRNYENDIADCITQIENLKDLLKGMKDIGVIQSQLSQEKDKLYKLEDRRTQTIKSIGVYEEMVSRKNKELSNLALQDEKNARIEKFKEYSQEIYKKLVDYYETEETNVRISLQDAINELFKQIYQGGMSISVDEKYRITVKVDQLEGFSSEIETSTAQSTSVIFAFIAGIIKLAKQFSTENLAEHELLATSEPYPLLMDAPLSNFDKRRIKAVCDTLPKVAEQVIIFIKDTDGDIAEEHMGSIIGKRYSLKRQSEIETYIVSR